MYQTSLMFHLLDVFDGVHLHKYAITSYKMPPKMNNKYCGKVYISDALVSYTFPFPTHNKRLPVLTFLHIYILYKKMKIISAINFVRCGLEMFSYYSELWRFAWEVTHMGNTHLTKAQQNETRHEPRMLECTVYVTINPCLYMIWNLL